MSSTFDFYVVFRKSDHGLPWWQRWFVWDEEFEHVGVIMQLGCDVLVCDASSEGLWFNKVYDPDIPGGYVSAEHVANRYVSEYGWRVVKYGSGKYQSVFHPSSILPTCVTMVKAIIGRRSWECTPWQLYKGLIRDGGTEMGGVLKPPKPDTSALQKQEQEAKAEKERLAKERQSEFLAQRRGQRGRRSLITNLGGEQGALGE